MVRFLKTKIKKKMAWEMYASYVIASLLPIALIVGFFVKKSMDSTEQNLIQMAEPYCIQIIDNVIDVVEEAENEIAILKSSDAMYSLLFTEYKNPADALTMYQTQWLNGTKYQINRDHTVKFYNTVANSNISALTNNSLDDFRRIYGEESLSAGDGIHYKLLPSYGSYPMRLSLYTSYASVDRQLFLTIEVPITEFLSSLDSGNGFGGFAYLLDDQGNIIGSTDSKDIYLESITPAFLESIEDSQSAYLEGETFLTILRPLSSKASMNTVCSNWKLLYLMPNELFRESMRTNMLSIVPLCVFSMVFSLGIAIFFTKWVCGRLDKLRSKTKRILNGEFDIAEPVRNNDELGELEEAIYEMASALDTMFKNQYIRLQKENEQKIRNEQLLRTTIQAEIDALRYQINPHYLFNTMESIRMHLYLMGDKETANIIRQFSESFRKMLDTDNSKYTLQDELETIECYLHVQKYRLGDRFVSSVAVDPALVNCHIPKLLIQPLVENAFFHGIELSERLGQLNIDIFRQEDRLHIQVIDNGIGMSKEKLRSLRNMLENPDSSSRVGLANIVRRLNLVYGENQSFCVESEQDKGTKIFVTIPYEPQKGGERLHESADC